MSDQLQIDPATVNFSGDLKAAQSTHKFSNVGQTKLAFQIKTTHQQKIESNKHYGCIESGRSINVVFSSSFDVAPPPTEKCKMLILFAFVPNDFPNDEEGIRAAWANMRGFESKKMEVKFQAAASNAPGQSPTSAGQPSQMGRGGTSNV